MYGNPDNNTTIQTSSKAIIHSRFRGWYVIMGEDVNQAILDIYTLISQIKDVGEDSNKQEILETLNKTLKSLIIINGECPTCGTPTKINLGRIEQ